MTHDLELKDFDVWLKFLNKDRPICIAGPCSAETEEQMMQTARQIKDEDLTIFRAGIWKPRTRPNSFEGIGDKGLPWLKRVRDEIGLFVTTEVAKAEHVEKALKYEIDILWVGARTTANPFAVQEIADALKGTNVPVMVKNPINPDVALWLGAIERIYSAGIDKIAAVHRGFSSFNTNKYRNEPQWQIPIELKRFIHQIPMICDPSHIVGNRDGLENIAQRAMDLNYDGLMVEAHFDPENAWSDASQQITPKELGQMLDRIRIRRTVGGNKKLFNALGAMRKLIDELDLDLLQVIEKRMKVAETIGLFKKQNDLVVLQSKRWEELMKNIMDIGTKKGLSKDFINAMFKSIHQESINKQTAIINEK